MKKKDSQLNI